MIKGHGNSGGKIVFIADHGSKDDMESGYALSKAAESMMRQLCNGSGLKLDTCWRTLLYKTHLEDFGWKKRGDERIAKEWIDKQRLEGIDPEEILLEEIRQLQPNVIVPLGNFTLKFLAGETPLNKFRGSILGTRDHISERLGRRYKIIPTFSPQEIFQTYRRYFIALTDFTEKIKPHCEFPEIPTDKDLVWICKSIEEFSNFLRRNTRPEFVTFDIETSDGIPTCISFCFDGREAISIPFISDDIDMANGVLLFIKCAAVLRSKIPKVNQNIKYDWTILERFGFDVHNIVGDTMLAAHALYPEFEKNLGFLTSLYTNVPYFKDEGKGSISFPPDRTHLLYNAKDALVTHKIYTAQVKEMEEANVLDFYKQRVMPLFFLYKDMEGEGVLVSEERRDRLRTKYEILLDMNQRELTEMVGYDFNPRSSQQVGGLIYEDLKYPKRSKTENGVRRWKTDRKTLEDLEILHGENNRLGKSGKLILSKIVLARRIAKVVEYINTPIHPDGRWRCSWNHCGAETGRTTAKKSIDQILQEKEGKWKFVKTGRSLQTITKHGFQLEGDDDEEHAEMFSQYQNLGSDLREMFVPTPGYVFVEIDQSQAEARHVAVLARDWETLAILEKTDFKTNSFGVKDDLHTITAMWVTGLSFESIDKEIRHSKGKPARHGGNYGLSPQMLALLEHISVGEARTILDRFHNASPKIRGVFYQEVRSAVQKTRELINPFGFRRQFFDRIDNEFFKAAYAHIPQGTVSQHQKYAMLRASADIKPLGRFLVEAHDSTLAEVKKGYKEDYAVIMKRELEQPIDFRLCTLSRDFELTVPVEMEYSDESWYHLEKFHV